MRHLCPTVECDVFMIDKNLLVLVFAVIDGSGSYCPLRPGPQLCSGMPAIAPETT